MADELMRVQGVKRGRGAAIKKFEKKWARTYNKACKDVVKGLKRYANEQPTPKKEKKQPPKQGTHRKLIIDKKESVTQAQKRYYEKNRDALNAKKRKNYHEKKKKMGAEPSPKKMKSGKKHTV